MKAVFVRHNMSSTPEILNELWSKRMIALHYKDDWSTNPEDYDKGEKPLDRLWGYCKSGAIVGADFKKIRPSQMLVGVIEPGSKVKAKRFGNYIYKIVQLKNTKEIFFQNYPLLLAIQPRQATVTGWDSAQKYLKAILEGEKLPWEVHSLAPSQLEVLCYEYLRKKEILSTLLMPIGRNMRHIDIVGINNQSEPVLAQITHSHKTREIKTKMQNLKNCKSKKASLYFFGPKSQKIMDEDINYVSIEDVFDFLTSDPKAVYYRAIQKMLGWQK